MNASAVSVIIPTHNRRAQVESLVRGLLERQTWSDFDVVVVDDGSTDDTTDALRAIGDRRVQVLARSHAGVSASRNEGAARSHSRWLVFLDSDDAVDDDWLATLVGLMSDDVDLVSIGQRRKSGSGVELAVPRSEGSAFADLDILWQAGAFAMRRALFDEAGGYTAGLAFSENTELALRVAEVYERRPFGHSSVDHPRCTVHIRPGRYDPMIRLQSAEQLIARHHGRLGRDRPLLATYHAMAGVAARKVGARRRAARHLAAAVATDRREIRHWLRLLRLAAPG